jgi:hypothetical protein
MGNCSDQSGRISALMKESAMANDLIRQDRPESSELHPLVYGSIVVLSAWLVLAAWVFFDDGAYTGLLLAVVSLFLFIFIALPAVLWLTWRKHSGENDGDHLPFRTWARSECVTWQCRLRGAEAAVQVLLPIAALAVGMTAIGIIFALVAAGVA